MRVRQSLVAVVVALSLALIAAVPASAEIRLSVEGTKQGQFKTEAGGGRGGPASLAATSYAYEVTSPRDAASGQASGKRKHFPVVVTRPVGAASPQFFQALTTNESLKTVQVEVVTAGSEKGGGVLYRIKLVNATVSNIKQSTDDKGQVIEEVSFTFQRIEFEHPEGKTMAVDDASGQR